MSDPTIFDDGTNQPTPVVTTPVSQSNPFVDKLMAIRNEKGEAKYKSVEDALDALAASQQFIETLKTEKKTVQEQLDAASAELAKRATLEDFVNKLKPTAAPATPSATPSTDAGLSEERVAQLLENTLQKREREAAEQRNLDGVVGKLSEQHGDKAVEFIKQRATELNTTPAALKELAKANPTMALTLLGAGSVKTNVSPSQPSLNGVPKTLSADDKPKVGLARGGYSNKELAEHFQRSKVQTNKRLGLET